MIKRRNRKQNTVERDEEEGQLKKQKGLAGKPKELMRNQRDARTFIL